MPRRTFSAVGMRLFVLNLAIPIAILAAGLSLTGCGSVGGSGGGTRALTVTPSAASFGNVVLKSESTQTVKVSNTGMAELKIREASITGPGFSMSGLVVPVNLAVGSSMNFTVSFEPTQAGAETGTVSIASDASASPQTVNLTGTGVTQSIKLTASPTSLNFGSVPVGKTETQAVTLTNAGNTDVLISNAFVTGAGFGASGGSNTTLGPNQSVTVTTSFDPQSNGSLTGALTVSSNGANITIPLSGTGIQQAAQHSVSLTWAASSSPVIGYFIYRRTGTAGAYSRVDSAADSSTSFTDSSVVGGSTYDYVVTAVSAENVESAFSAEVSVTIPTS